MGLEMSLANMQKMQNIAERRLIRPISVRSFLEIGDVANRALETATAKYSLMWMLEIVAPSLGGTNGSVCGPGLNHRVQTEYP